MWDRSLWSCFINGREIGIDNPVDRSLKPRDGGKVDAETYKEAQRLFDEHLEEHRLRREEIRNRKIVRKEVVVDKEEVIKNIGEEISKLLTDRKTADGKMLELIDDRADYLQTIVALI